jgi:hypothetical protein
MEELAMSEMRIYTGITEAAFGSGSNGWEMNHYETSFAVGQNGLETTGSVCSGSVTVYEVVGVNRTGTTLFVHLFDLTGGPGPGYRPICSLPVLSSSEKGFSWRTGKSLQYGLQMGWSTEYASFTGSANAGSFYAEYKR